MGESDRLDITMLGLLLLLLLLLRWWLWETNGGGGRDDKVGRALVDGGT